MDWLNLHTSVLHSEEFVGAEPVDRATWLCLLRHCAGQENGGVIRAARAWGDRRWQQVCSVTLREVGRETSLWTWVADDLHVSFYPLDKEEEVRGKRSAGRIGGLARTQAKTQAAQANGAKHQPKQEPKQEPKQNPSGNPTEGKGRERKGSGREADPPPPIPFNGETTRIDTVALLAEFGLGASPKQAAEWRGGLNQIARCRSLPEARAFLRWALSVCRAQSVEVSYWRHVKVLAEEWHRFKRAEIWETA